MKVLALDTALGACQAAVLDGERTLASRTEAMLRGHQERLGVIVQSAMAQAGLGFAQLDRIGVTVGPGSFTGVRVGLAFAKGLSLSLGVPLVGIGALDALAASAAQEGLVTAVIDAKRGQAYLQSFRDGIPLGPPQALAVDDAQAQVVRLGPHRIVGPGAQLMAGLAGADILPLEAPDPTALATLAAEAAPPAQPPRPIYLRPPDARLAT